MRVMLCWLLGVALVPGPARGDPQDDHASTKTSPARYWQDVGYSPVAVTVITREDIRTSGARDLVELLRMVPGLDVVVSSPHSASVSGRLDWTAWSNRFLVLVDGAEMNLELNGHSGWQVLPVSLQEIQRVEVLHGPLAAPYQSRALAGVISITTMAADDRPAAGFWLEGGKHSGPLAAGRLAAGLGDFSFLGSAAGELGQDRGWSRQRSRLRLRAGKGLGRGGRLWLEGTAASGAGPLSPLFADLDGDLSVGGLRLWYQGARGRIQVAWRREVLSTGGGRGFEYNNVPLGRLLPATITGDLLSAEALCELPRAWEPLSLVLGASGRAYQLSSDQLVAGTLAGADRWDPERSLEPGVSRSELHTAGFALLEVFPTDWLTVLASLRLDHRQEEALSYRLGAVLAPADGHFLRLGAARSLRSPTFAETYLQMPSECPGQGPFAGERCPEIERFLALGVGTGKDQKEFGISVLGEEKLSSIEAGYLGRLLGERLQVSLELFYSVYAQRVVLERNLVLGQDGLLSAQESHIHYVNAAEDLAVAGGELWLSLTPARGVRLLASWTHRQVLGRGSDASPKNLLALGGSLTSEQGLTGSLYSFTRSGFQDRQVPSAEGFLEEPGSRRMGTELVLLGRLGFRREGLEVGLKVFVPLGLSARAGSGYREAGGGIAPGGASYGGWELERAVTLYLEGWL